MTIVKHKIREDQGDGFRIDTSFGFIQYRPTDECNEIWYIESNQRGGGSILMDLMLEHHPSDCIAWGATSEAGQAFRTKWHAQHPAVMDATDGERVPFDGQFDPFDDGGFADDDEWGEVNGSEATIPVHKGGNVSEEDLRQAQDALKRWTDEHYDTEIADRVRSRRFRFVLQEVRPAWRDKTFRFEIFPPNYRGDRWTRYRVPADALTEIPANQQWAYRGMSWEEWQYVRRTGTIQSKGEHNFSNQTSMTFYSPEPASAQHYAAGFAPWWNLPNKRRPGVVVAVRRSALMDHTADPAIPNGELAHKGPLAATEIKAVWFVVPEEVFRGFMELTVDNKTGMVSEGNRNAPMGRGWVVMPATTAVNKELERAPEDVLAEAAEVLAAGDLLTRVEKTVEQHFKNNKEAIVDFVHVLCSALERDDAYIDFLVKTDKKPIDECFEEWMDSYGGELFKVYKPWQKYVPWLGQQIAKLSKEHGVPKLEALLPYVREDSEPNFWALLAKKGTQGLSLQQVIDDFKSLKKNLSVLQGEVVQNLSGEWTLQKLTTKEQLAQEGQILDHCVGGYWADVRDGKTEIYSVRDETGTPQATLEWKEKKIKQIYGKSDTPFPSLDPTIRRHIREAVIGFFEGNFSGRRLMNDKFTADDLEKLAVDEDPLVREWVAENPNTPVTALEKLAVDRDPVVREWVAQHPNTPVTALEKLAVDESAVVRRGTARHPSTPASALEKLAGDRNDVVMRQYVAENPNTPVTALEKLAVDESAAVCRCTARHPSTPASALEKLAGNVDSWVRQWVTRNPNTSVPVLEKLAGDRDADVRKWAKEALQKRQATPTASTQSKAAAIDPSAHQIDMSDPRQNMDETVQTPADQMRLALNTLESEFSVADGELITPDDVARLRELTAEIRKLVEAFESKSAAYRVEHDDKPRSGDE